MHISIPGNRIHELPPLLVNVPSRTPAPVEVLEIARCLVESEDLIPVAAADASLSEQRKFDLALNLVEQYRGLVAHWQWGDSIIEWIRQCEITFETHDDLRRLLHPDLWPHASRTSFVTLLRDKNVPTEGVGLEKAVGLRLTFRQPPPIDCFSNQFLLYLNSPV
ncbi:MAG: hypothetical protein FJW37_00090, partial [Acidobacteria bacterium]|nr:hypothetical protein [Acidobacteriota bacterium]